MPDAAEDDGASAVFRLLARFPVDTEFFHNLLTCLVNRLEGDLIWHGGDAQHTVCLLVVFEQPELALGLRRRHRLEFIFGLICGVPRSGVDILLEAEPFAQVIDHVVLLDVALDVGGVHRQSHLETADRIFGLFLTPAFRLGFDQERIVAVLAGSELLLEVGTQFVFSQHGKPEAFLLVLL